MTLFHSVNPAREFRSDLIFKKMTKKLIDFEFFKNEIILKLNFEIELLFSKNKNKIKKKIKEKNFLRRSVTSKFAAPCTCCPGRIAS